MMPRYEAEGSLLVIVDVHDPEVIERVTGAGGDEWRSRFYSLHTAADVVKHLAANAAAGVTDVSRLEGWADLSESAVSFDVQPVDFYYVEETAERV